MKKAGKVMTEQNKVLSKFEWKVTKGATVEGYIGSGQVIERLLG